MSYPLSKGLLSASRAYNSQDDNSIRHIIKMSSVCYIPSPSSSSPALGAKQRLGCKTTTTATHTAFSVTFPLLLPRRAAIKVVLPRAAVTSVEDDKPEEFQVLTAIKSSYNDIVILDTADSRFLLLDSTNNVHSIFNKGKKWTGSYWDQFATLPAIVPQGPIAIFGLGGGTAAHLLLELWPSLQLHGWEIDEILIDKARDYLGLSDLEKQNEAGGIVHVHVGDALSSSASVPGGYAGIIIDLFSDGQVLPQLQEVETWLTLRDRLMPNGRFMVNCGGAGDGLSDVSHIETDSENSLVDDSWESNSTIKALYRAFPRELSWKKLSKTEGENFLALTGPLPDLTLWADALPDQLSSSVTQWRICLPS